MRKCLAFFIPGLAVFGVSIIAFAVWVGGKSVSDHELAYFAGIPGMALGASLMTTGALAVRRPKSASAARKQPEKRPGIPDHDAGGSMSPSQVIGGLLLATGSIILMGSGILLMSGIITLSLYFYISCCSGAGLVLLGQLIRPERRPSAPTQTTDADDRNLVPENTTGRATIDDKQLCYLCGKPLNAQELSVRVCEACRA